MKKIIVIIICVTNFTDGSLIGKYDNITPGMGKSILIVEDDEELLVIYKEILEIHKFEVITAKDGKEGVDRFLELKPSLVIMDGDMPILNGYDAFKQIKKIDKDANVVIVTGFSEFDPKNQDAIKMGLIKVISKPIGVDDLLFLAKKYGKNKIKTEM